MDTRKTAIASLLLLVVLFFAVNIAGDRGLRGVRIDLTDHKLYTLSEGTRELLRDLEEPITLTLFFSEDLAAGQPQLQSYGKRVRELLEEYAIASGGTIRVRVVDPEPFSEGEEQAQRAGISGLSTGGSGQFYFGLLGVNSTDGREVIPFFDPREERFLEYNLSRVVYNLANPERKKVVVLSSLPVDGGQPLPGQRPPQPWQIMAELRTLFEVETLPPGAEEIPGDADVLLIIHPKNLGEPTLRAIDSFVLGGGRAIVFVDPVAEADMPPGAEQNPLAAMQADRSSNLDALLEAWGARMEPGQVAADLTLALPGQARDGQVVSYVQYLGIPAETMSDEDPVTGPLAQLQVGLAGALVPVEGAGTTFTPLVQTTDQSMLLESQRVSFFPDPRELLASFVPRGEPLTLAARLTGTARSAFAPAPSDGAEAGPPSPAEAPADAPTGEINVIVVSDVDMLSDPMWVREVRIGGMVLGYQQLSDNGAFLVNAVDNLTGSGELISIRARGSFTRPFTLVNEIRTEAERKYLARQQQLEERRREAQQRISELQRARPDQGDMILTPEQQAEIDRFREELVETSRELRDVNYNLRKDVEALGLRLKIINIAAAPLAVFLAAIGLAGFRAARRRRHRTQTASRRGS